MKPLVWVFFMSIRGLFQAECIGLRAPKCSSFPMCGVIPSLAFRSMWYLQTFTGFTPGLAYTQIGVNVLLAPLLLFQIMLMGTSEAICPARGQAKWLPDTVFSQITGHQHMNGFPFFIKQFSSSIREIYLGFHFGQWIRVPQGVWAFWNYQQWGGYLSHSQVHCSLGSPWISFNTSGTLNPRLHLSLIYQPSVALNS